MTRGSRGREGRADDAATELLGGAGFSLLCAPALIRAGRAQSAPVTLLSAPLELIGEWGGSPPQAAARVIARMREVSLAGVKLLSDQQPERLRVEDHTSGRRRSGCTPIRRRTAWIIVDIGAVDWCKLAYQFGHELGHVLCNSWGPLAKPAPPCQWLEEALVEAFSIRGLGLLAASWEENPPFAGDAPFAKSIRDYRANLVEKYRKASWQAASGDIASGFRANRSALERSDWGSAVLTMLAEEEARPDLRRGSGCAQPLAGAQRGPGRGIPDLVAGELRRARRLRPSAGAAAQPAPTRLRRNKDASEKSGKTRSVKLR